MYQDDPLRPLSKVFNDSFIVYHYLFFFLYLSYHSFFDHYYLSYEYYPTNLEKKLLYCKFDSEYLLFLDRCVSRSSLCHKSISFFV